MAGEVADLSSSGLQDQAIENEPKWISFLCFHCLAITWHRGFCLPENIASSAFLQSPFLCTNKSIGWVSSSDEMH